MYNVFKIITITFATNNILIRSLYRGFIKSFTMYHNLHVYYNLNIPQDLINKCKLKLKEKNKKLNASRIKLGKFCLFSLFIISCLFRLVPIPKLVKSRDVHLKCKKIVQFECK